MRLENITKSIVLMGALGLLTPAIANQAQAAQPYKDSELKKSRDSGRPYDVQPGQPAIIVSHDGAVRVQAGSVNATESSFDFRHWGSKLAQKLDDLDCVGPIFGSENDQQSNGVKEHSITPLGGVKKEGFPDLVVQSDFDETTVYFPDTSALIGTMAWAHQWTGSIVLADSCEDLAKPSRFMRGAELRISGNGNGGVALYGTNGSNDTVYVNPRGSSFWGKEMADFPAYVTTNLETLGIPESETQFLFVGEVNDDNDPKVIARIDDEGAITYDLVPETVEDLEDHTPENPWISGEIGPTDAEVFGPSNVESSSDEPLALREVKREDIAAVPILQDHSDWVLYDLNLRPRTVRQVPLADMICEGTEGLMIAGTNGRWRESVQTIANEGSNRSSAYAALGDVVSQGTHPVCDSWGTEQEIIAYNRDAFGFGNEGTAKANGQLARKFAETNQMYLPANMVPGDGGTLLNIEEINQNAPEGSLFDFGSNSDGVAYLVPKATTRKQDSNLEYITNESSGNGNDSYHSYVLERGAEIQAEFVDSTVNSYTVWARENLSINDQEVARESQALVAARFYLESAEMLSHEKIVAALEEEFDYGVSHTTVRRRIKDGLTEMLGLSGSSQVRTMHEAREVASLYTSSIQDAVSKAA
jgi:hypothetical protein